MALLHYTYKAMTLIQGARKDPIIRTADSSHWYEANGTPAYTRTTAKGDERPTTLRDARKEGLLPSVTTVLGILKNPVLEKWKLENILTAALTLPRIEGETVTDFARRAAIDADSVGRKAAGFGTLMHAAMESWALHGQWVRDPVVDAHMGHFTKWWTDNIVRVVAVEQSVVGKEGYAGKYDLLAEHQAHGLCLIDYKTQNVKKGTPGFYESWARQLAAYRHASGLKCGLLSLVIDSNVASPPVEKLWPAEEVEDGLQTFLLANQLWQRINAYYPAGGGK